MAVAAMSFETACAAAGGTYYFFCEVDSSAVVTLEWNETAKAYEKKVSNNNPSDNGIRRRAWKDAVPVWVEEDPQSQDAWSMGMTSAASDAEPSSSALRFNDPPQRLLQTASSNNNNNDTATITPPRAAVVQARICPCSENPHYETQAFYCAADKTYCAVPASYYQQPEAPLCLDLVSSEIFARSIWPVIMIWFCLSILFCMCTTPGRHAVEYMLVSTCLPSWNDRIIRNWLTRQPGRAHELWRRHWDRERYGSPSGPSYFPWRPGPGGPLGGGGRKVEFILKTCLYHAPPATLPEDGNETSPRRNGVENGGAVHHDGDNGDDDEQRPTCSICFIPLEEGVKIGKLQCGHLFHSECIKG